MKRGFVVCLILLTLISMGCAGKEKNITFQGVIEAVSDNTILVTTTDDVGFDRASVSFLPEMRPDFQPQSGQRVELVILPEIRESYPVQVTAVKIRLLN